MRPIEATQIQTDMEKLKCWWIFAILQKKKNNTCLDSLVDIATRYGLDGPGIASRWGARFSAPVQTGPGAHPAFYTMGTESFPGVKRPGRGVDHPPPSSAEVE